LETNQGQSDMMIRPLITLLAAAFALAACNTVEGAGRDLSSAGKAITKTSQDVRD
jgi:predicted small secreted protein